MFLFRPRPGLSIGEKNFIVALSGIGIVGAVLAMIVTLRLIAHGEPALAFDPFTVWTVIAGAVGAACGFLSSYERWLGFPNVVGWIRAAIGGVLISGVASVVCGTLILPYYGTMFAPFQFVIAMIEYPILGGIWLSILICVHKLVGKWRHERESIFERGVQSA